MHLLVLRVFLLLILRPQNRSSLHVTAGLLVASHQLACGENCSHHQHHGEPSCCLVQRNGTSNSIQQVDALALLFIDDSFDASTHVVAGWWLALTVPFTFMPATAP